MSEKENIVEDKRKNKYTIFLERNEIWFKTVLSLTVTVAALLVSFASYKTAEYQTQLSAAATVSQAKEKQPFFSIEHMYDDKRQQYIYGIINTGGQVRYSNISVFPYLHIYQQDNQKSILSPMDVIENVESRYINQAFIYLPGFCNYDPVSFFDNGLIAFSDVWVEITRLCGHSPNDLEEVLERELADEYFSEVVSSNNNENTPTTMSSEIVYLIEIVYYNYENKVSKESIWLGRSADLFQKTTGNTQLLFNDGLDMYYQEASIKGCTFAVDSMNESIESVLEKCNVYIDTLFEAFDQISEY